MTVLYIQTMNNSNNEEILRSSAVESAAAVEVESAAAVEVESAAAVEVESAAAVSFDIWDNTKYLETYMHDPSLLDDKCFECINIMKEFDAHLKDLFLKIIKHQRIIQNIIVSVMSGEFDQEVFYSEMQNVDENTQYNIMAAISLNERHKNILRYILFKTDEVQINIFKILRSAGVTISDESIQTRSHAGPQRNIVSLSELDHDLFEHSNFVSSSQGNRIININDWILRNEDPDVDIDALIARRNTELSSATDRPLRLSSASDRPTFPVRAKSILDDIEIEDDTFVDPDDYEAFRNLKPQQEDSLEHDIRREPIASLIPNKEPTSDDSKTDTTPLFLRHLKNESHVNPAKQESCSFQMQINEISYEMTKIDKLLNFSCLSDNYPEFLSIRQKDFIEESITYFNDMNPSNSAPNNILKYDIIIYSPKTPPEQTLHKGRKYNNAFELMNINLGSDMTYLNYGISDVSYDNLNTVEKIAFKKLFRLMEQKDVDVILAQNFKSDKTGSHIITFAVRNIYINDEQGRLGTFPYRLINIYPEKLGNTCKPACSIITFPDDDSLMFDQ
jgi:hypothetical protein